MKAAVVAILLLDLSIAFAQPPDTVWTRTIYAPHGSTEARAVYLTQDGGYAVAGMCCGHLPPFHHYWFYKAFVAKFTRAGDLSWSWEDLWHGDGGSLGAHDILETPDGGFIIVGNDCFYGNDYDYSLWAARLTADGDPLWERVHEGYGGGRAVALAPDGGFLIAGVGDFSLSKLDSAGNLLWNRNWGISLEDITPLADDNYICVGHSESGGPACLMVKVTTDGDTLWTRDCNTSFDELANAVTATADGGFAICGSLQVLSYPRDMFMALKTADGDHLMTRGYECYPCEAMDIRQANDGGFVLAGSVTFHGQSGDSTCIGVLRTEPNLDQRWMKTWGGTGNDGAYAVVQDSDSCYAVVGHWGSDSWYIAKLAAHPMEVDERDHAAAPNVFTLRSFPNPFNPATTLSFTLPRPAHARLAVYDVLGREVRIVADESLTAGEHRASFDGSDLPSGIYFARLQSGEFVTTQKLLLLK
ncbi:T9SS type A sorting domain-containing protein [bacterium]|nr:T9SS type A sorting domain-containing protein [bacterium]MBU1985074.1 T9SS type A sorting domain-containing protein [bacterium]